MTEPDTSNTAAIGLDADTLYAMHFSSVAVSISMLDARVTRECSVRTINKVPKWFR